VGVLGTNALETERHNIKKLKHKIRRATV